MVIVYIYCLINPLNRKPFYVGATINPEARLKEHTSKSRIATRKDPIIEKIKQAGREVGINILYTTDIKNASFWERFYFEKFQIEGFKLYQSTRFSYSNLYKQK